MKIIQCKNIFTDVEYQALQYNNNGYHENNVSEVKDFIKEINLPIRVIKPKLIITGLKDQNRDTELNDKDYIIKTIRENPLYNVVNKEIFNSNFTITADIS